jgi:hypothetical protein
MMSKQISVDEKEWQKLNRIKENIKKKIKKFKEQEKEARDYGFSETHISVLTNEIKFLKNLMNSRKSC